MNKGVVDLSFPICNEFASSGGLFLSGNSGFVTLGLDSLATISVGGSILIGNSQVAMLQIPLLSQLAGSLIVNMSALHEIELPSLSMISGTMGIEKTQIEALRFPSLFEVPGSLRVIENSELVDLSLEILRSISILIVERNSKLARISLNSMENFISILIFDNPMLKELVIPMLISIGSQFFIVNNPSLNSINLSNWISGNSKSSLEIAENQNLQIIDLRYQVCFLKNTFILRNNPNLRVIYLSVGSNCPNLIQSTGNPLLEYVYVESS